MDIKKIRLYRGSKKIIRQLNFDLNRLQLASGPLTSLQLQELDQRHHYGGVGAVDEAIDLCRLNDGAKVINIGSGLGGPSRHVATSVANSQVLAIELQHDLHSHAQMLTDRCNLGDRVTHMAGDFLEVERYLNKGEYDAIVSWLTVLHFTNRFGLFQSCYDLLCPGGTMYVCDLCAVRDLSVRERQDMRSEVYCNDLASSSLLVREMESVGFRLREVKEKTEEWKEIVVRRVEEWIEKKDQTIEALSLEGYQDLLKFYTMIRDMFLNGNVGGVLLCATKPKGW
jgi:sterol 24-C-methyltransferase/phosphoethanolamine N-methyltransferase